MWLAAGWQGLAEERTGVAVKNEKTPHLEGFIFNLITFQKERGFIKYYGAKIIIIFISTKKLYHRLSSLFKKFSNTFFSGRFNSYGDLMYSCGELKFETK